MNDGIWVYTKSGNWYKPNGDRTLQHTARIVSGKKMLIPCKDHAGLKTYLNTDEIECVKEFRGKNSEDKND